MRSGSIITRHAKIGTPKKKRTGVTLNPLAVAESEHRVAENAVADAALKSAEDTQLAAASDVLARIKLVWQSKAGQIFPFYHAEMKSLHLQADANINTTRSLIKLQVQGKQMAADLSNAMKEMRDRAIIVPTKDSPYTPAPPNYVFTESQNSSTASTTSTSDSSVPSKRRHINSKIAAGINRIDKSRKCRKLSLITAASDYAAVTDSYLNQRDVKCNSLISILPSSSSTPSLVTAAQIETAVLLLERAQKERRNEQMRSDKESYVTKNAETALYLIVSDPPVTPFHPWNHFVGHDDITASILNRLVKAFHEDPSRPTEVSRRILNE